MNNQTAYLIKERAPEFPCWIWLDKGDDVLGEWLWFAHEVDYHRAVKCWRLTHWCGQSQMPTTYPDQPTAPMLAPDAPKVRLKTKEEFIRVIAPDAPKETPALDAFQQPDATIPHTISVSAEGAGPSNAPQAGTPTPDPYAYEYATTPKEKELYSAIASGFSTKGMLYDDEMKEAIFGMVRPALTMWERELAALTAERDGLKEQVSIFAKVADNHKAAETTLRTGLAAAEQKVGELTAWKESAMAVDREWDAQAVGRLLEIPLGHSIRAGIEPAVRALINQSIEYDRVAASTLENIHRLESALTAANSARDAAIKERDEARANLAHYDAAMLNNSESLIDPAKVLHLVSDRYEREYASLRTQLTSALARIEELEGRK